MKQHSRDTSGKAFTIGKKAEDDFVIFAKERGYEVTPATFQENTKQHFDYVLKKGDTELKVDVKAAKRINRRDNNTQTDLIWLEYLNGNGDTGWLSGGATHIAFQEGDTYLIVDREKLLDRANSLNTGKQVTSAGQALYNLYTRFKRNDLLTMVKRSDIEDLHEEL